MVVSRLRWNLGWERVQHYTAWTIPLPPGSRTTSSSSRLGSCKLGEPSPWSSIWKRLFVELMWNSSKLAAEQLLEIRLFLLRISYTRGISVSCYENNMKEKVTIT